MIWLRKQTSEDDTNVRHPSVLDTNAWQAKTAIIIIRGRSTYTEYFPAWQSSVCLSKLQQQRKEKRDGKTMKENKISYLSTRQTPMLVTTYSDRVSEGKQAAPKCVPYDVRHIPDVHRGRPV